MCPNLCAFTHMLTRLEEGTQTQINSIPFTCMFMSPYSSLWYDSRCMIRNLRRLRPIIICIYYFKQQHKFSHNSPHISFTFIRMGGFKFNRKVLSIWYNSSYVFPRFTFENSFTPIHGTIVQLIPTCMGMPSTSFLTFNKHSHGFHPKARGWLVHASTYKPLINHIISFTS